MKTHWIKTLTVGATTSLILFQAGADEIEDAFQAARAAEITRGVEDEQAARRALIRARERILADESAGLKTPVTAAEDAEDLVGEINSLEDLKAKLKRELDSLRELDVPEETPTAVVSQPSLAPTVNPVPVQVGATTEEWQAFQQSINQQIANWREQDLKQAVEQRAAISREQQGVKDTISTLIGEVEGRIASLTEKRETEVSELASTLMQQQEQLKAQESRLSEQISSSQKEVASMTASINEKLETITQSQSGKDELKSSLEAMIGDLDAEIKTLKLAQEQQAPAGASLEDLAKEIERQVAEATASDELAEKIDQVGADQSVLQESMKAEIASLREDLAKKPEPVETAEVDTTELEEKIRAELMADMSKEIERLSREMAGKQEQTAQALAALKGQLEESKELADAVQTLSVQVEESQVGVASLKEWVEKRATEAIEGSASLTETQQAELVQYRKSLKDEVTQLREELRNALKTEIAGLAALIEVEKTARLESTGVQEAKLVELETSLKEQIAQSLADMPSGAASDEEAVLAIVNNATKDLEKDILQWKGTVEERIASIKTEPAPSAGTSDEIQALKASIDETLASFRKEADERQLKDLSQLEFTLKQYMDEINVELASFAEGAAAVATVVAVVAVSESEPVDAEALAGDVEKPAEVEVSKLSPEEEAQRKSLLELREKLRASIENYKQKPAETVEPVGLNEAAEKALIQDLADEMPEEYIEEPLEETPEPKKKKSWFRIWGGDAPEASIVEDETLEESSEVSEENLQEEIDQRLEATEMEEADVVETTEEVEEELSEDVVLEEEPKRGFFSRLFGGGKAADADSAELPGIIVTNTVEDVVEVVEAPAEEELQVEDEGEEIPEEDLPVEDVGPVVVRPEDLKTIVEVAEEVEIIESTSEVEELVAEDAEEIIPETSEETVSEKKGIFSRMFGGSKSEKATDAEEIEEPEAEVEGVVEQVEEVVESVESEVPESVEEAAESVEETVEAVEEVILEEEAPRKGFFSKLFGGSGAKEAPEEVLDLNGDDAEPKQNGEEGFVVEEIRGTLDRQISVIDQELDQHPIFDFEEVEVAPPATKVNSQDAVEGPWKYTGGWLKGQMHGAGSLTYPDGRIYEGEWDKGLRQGEGTLTHPDGWTFSGEWKKGLINGQGTLSYEDGWAYEGNWSNGRMDGAGVLTHPEGWIYTGEWSSGAMDGEGRLEYEDGWAYEGNWVNGEREGRGTLSHQDGWNYEGDWNKGRRSGNGTLTFADGWSYTGEWKDGTMNGYGRLTHPDGWAYEGDWDNGAMAGEGSIVIED